jgi:hypothetical protein
MLITQNITSRTQVSSHMNYTNLCNEEKRTKPLNNQTNISKENNSTLWK